MVVTSNAYLEHVECIGYCVQIFKRVEIVVQYDVWPNASYAMCGI